MYEESMEIPRSGFAGAVTCTPSACSRSITLFQLDPSAKAPCTRTTVGRDPSCGYAFMASSFRTRFLVAGHPFQHMHDATGQSLVRTAEKTPSRQFVNRP